MAWSSSGASDDAYDAYEEPRKARRSKADGKRPGAWVARFLTMLALIACLVACGFFACLAPPATSLFAKWTANAEVSPFEKSQLVEVAEATRDYSFFEHDVRDLYSVIYRINSEYQAAHPIVQSVPETQGEAGQGVPSAGSPGGISTGVQMFDQALGLGTGNTAGAQDQAVQQQAAQQQAAQQQVAAQPDLTGLTAESTAVQYELAFSGASPTYVFDRETINHLDDCYRVSHIGFIALAIIAGLALIGFIFIGIRAGRRALGWTFKAAGILVLAAFVALGVWVVLDFNGLFAAFHQLFFSAGSWEFPYDSLLICALPTGFWVGMGALWIVTSVLASILCIVIGSGLRKRK